MLVSFTAHFLFIIFLLQVCHLLGPTHRGDSVAQQLNQFLCFTCRKPGDYSHQQSPLQAVSKERIEKAAKDIEKQQSHIMTRHYGNVVSTHWNPPARLEDYQKVEQVLATYDFNAIAARQGELYVAIKNFFTAHQNEVFPARKFSELTIPQVVFFGLLLVCDTQDINIPPIWDRVGAAADRLANLLDQEKKQKWILTLEAELKNLEKKTQTLKQASKEVAKQKLGKLRMEQKQHFEEVNKMKEKIVEASKNCRNTKLKEQGEEQVLKLDTMLGRNIKCREEREALQDRHNL